MHPFAVELSDLAGLLPGFIEVYNERNLGVKLKRK
jgi:hypothetical protein